jgi:hypothetical protein
MQHHYRKLKTHKTTVKHKKTSEPSSTMNSDEISQQIINNVKSNARKITVNAKGAIEIKKSCSKLSE